MCNCNRLELPECGRYLCPGNRIRLGRFDCTTWIVQFGWIACNGNRPICAWYLVNTENPSETKLLSKPDLDDIYFVQI